jgi:hypothetical protein
MKELWNKRYQDPEYAYGLKPNEYLKTILGRIQHKGAMLLPAEGEGRNAVYAAGLGFDVTAVDISEQGKEKAMKWAQKKNLSIDYLVGDLKEVELEENKYDILVFIYAHFPSSMRKTIHLKFQKYLKKYGYIILEGFSTNHIEVSKHNKTRSGPPNIDMLFTKEMIADDFSSFETIEIAEKVIDLDEGAFHQGNSSVVRYMGRKI